MAGLTLITSTETGPAVACTRKAGCKCTDCAEMAGLTLKQVTQSDTDNTAEVKENLPHPNKGKSGGNCKTPAAKSAAAKDTPSGTKARRSSGSSAKPQGPSDRATPAPSEAALQTSATKTPKSTSKSQASPPAKAPKTAFAAMTTCLRRAGCTCADCAEMAGLTLATSVPDEVVKDDEDVAEDTHQTMAGDETLAVHPVEAGASAEAVAVESPGAKRRDEPTSEAPVQNSDVKCIRKAGCKCADCAEMSGLTSAPDHQARVAAFSSPSQAGPASNKKSVLKKSVSKTVKPSPAFKAEPEFRPIGSPAATNKDESGVFSPEGFDNAEALKDLLEDDGLELDDLTDLRISAVNEAMRAEMKAALEQHAASKEGEPKQSDKAKPSEAHGLSEAGKAAAAAPSEAGSSSAVRYTLEDVERISAFNMEALKRRMEAEVADLCSKLEASRKDAKASVQALEDENKTLKSTMGEAEKAIDELVAVVDKEKKDAAKHLKSFTDMKSYADELESAFNGLHGRYTKLKEYYTASDANNQVLYTCRCSSFVAVCTQCGVF